SELDSELTSLAGTELGSELTSLAGSELSLASYRHSMLDRTDFASWQQRIRLYFRGKENRVNILKSIDEGPFQMGTLRETLTGGTKGGQDNIVDEDMDEQPIQDLALNVDNVFQANDCDAFDSNVDEAPIAQTLFMANLSSADPDNAMQVVQSDVSAVPNNPYMMILNDMHEPPAQHVYVTTQTKVVDKSLTAELATYKEQFEHYERRARFELTEREQKIDEQLRIVITDRNIKEENLKKELL
nr:retrovirus-related Pol polyprotein from transposon TNT 1-94 [Tanacetum cinerariifolium]